MVRQLQRTVEYLGCLPVTVLSIDNIEADDTIAYISEQVLPESEVSIMSSDKDFIQLVSDRVSVWSPVKKRIYNPENVLEDYGIPPHNFLMYRMLDGDKSDNIPGVNGIGLKTIQKKLSILLEDEIVSIDKLLKFAKTSDEKIKAIQELGDNKELLERNYKLMQLREVDISTSAKSKIRNTIDKPIQTLVKFNFQKMFMEDKMWNGIPNLDSWLLTTFNQLNKYAKISNEKKV